MANVYNSLNIQYSEKLNEESNYFDVRLFLDLNQESIKHRKDFALPLELECFLPYGFDVLPNIEQDNENIYDLLNIKDLVKKHTVDKHKEFTKNTITIGNNKAVNTYPSVSKILKQSNIGAYKGSAISRKAYKKDESVLLHPLKLMLSTITYNQIAVEDQDEKELMELLIDKITLAALLPYIAHSSVWPGIKKDDGTFLSYEEIKAKVLDKLLIKNPLNGYVHPSMIEEKYAIKLNSSETWVSLIEYTLDTKDEHSKLLFPIDLLDETLSDHLQVLYDQLKSENAEDNQFKYSMDNVAELSIDPKLKLRTDYGFFYPIVDEFLKKQNVRKGLQLLKQKYNTEDISGFLPFVEEIDFRPIVWSREAMQITTEMNIAAKKYKWAKERFEKEITKDAATDIIEQICNDLRKASSNWHIAKSRYEHLKNKTGKEGIELTLQEHKSTDGAIIDRFFTLTRKRVEAKNVVLMKSKLEKWTENYTVRRCKRSFFFKRCWNEYRTRELSNWRTWYETVVHYYTVDDPITIDYDPISSYLEKDINIGVVDTKENLTRAQSLAAALNLPQEGVVKISSQGGAGQRKTYEGVKNKHKEVHIFDYTEGEYRDQNGIPLSVLLRELESSNYDQSDIKPNQKKLFIIPQLKRTLSGETSIEKYLAVHNPIGGRRTNIAPNIYIVETYKQSVQQVPGHWLGKLSHTTCLFPGETRRLKIVTESKHESNISQDSRSKQAGSFRQKVDVRDQVRHELEQENKTSDTKNWSVSASGGGSWGVSSVKASVSSSGSKTNSSSRVAKSLNDKVSEVLNDVSSSNEVQFVTTSTEKASVTSTSESIVDIKNVNQGRSINYKFFQILHKYVSMVTLEEIRIVVEYGHEVIPGLDVVQTKVYSLMELDNLLPDLVEEERASVIKQVRSLIIDRYKESLLLDENKNPVDINKEIIITQDQTYVNSGAFYLDNEVSLLPATEEYVERARNEEINEQVEKTNRIKAEAKAIDAGRWMLYDNLPSGYKHASLVSNSNGSEATDGQATFKKDE